MKKALFFCFVVVFLLLLSRNVFADSSSYYVSTQGNDQMGDGTLSRPFATITRARDEVRSNQGIGKSFRVLIRGGVYELAAPVRFSELDTQTTYEAYPGETPIFRAVRKKVTDWTVQDGIYTSYPGTNLSFFRMFEGEQTATQARWPDEGYARAISSLDGAGIIQRNSFRFGEETPFFAEGQKVIALLWPGGENGERNWFENCIPVTSRTFDVEGEAYSETVTFDAQTLQQSSRFSYTGATLEQEEGEGQCLRLSSQGSLTGTSPSFTRKNLAVQGDLEYTTRFSIRGMPKTYGRVLFYVGSNQFIMIGSNKININCSDPVTGNSKTQAVGDLQEGVFYSVTLKLYFNEQTKQYETFDVWVDGIKKTDQPLLVRQPFEALTTFQVGSLYAKELGVPSGENQLNIQSYTLKAQSWQGKGTIRLSSNASYQIGTGSRYYLLGAREFLNKPGEFYYDSITGRLDYIPLFPEPEVVIPFSGNLFEFAGKSSSTLVRSITLKGLTIQGTDKDYNGILTKNAENLVFDGCRILDVGEHGVFVSGNNRKITVKNCEIARCGESGVELAGGSGNKPTSGDHTIVNNYIHHMGLIDGQGSCVHVNNSENNEISHNLMTDSRRYAVGLVSSRPHSIIGTTIGGILVTEENVRSFTHTQNNTISYNEIYRCITDSQDCGPINFWGTDVGNKVYYNKIYDCHVPFSFGTGIYVDDGADDVDVFGNLLYGFTAEENARVVSMFLIKGVGNRVRNNVVADNAVSPTNGGVFFSQQMADEPSHHLEFSENIISHSGARLYWFVNWEEERLANSDQNLYYDPSAGSDPSLYSNSGVRKETLSQWREITGFDQNSMLTDPLFSNPSKRDYRLQKNSAAYQLGFSDLPVEQMGLSAVLPFHHAKPEVLYLNEIGEPSRAYLTLSEGEQMKTELTARSKSGFLCDISREIPVYSGYDSEIITVSEDGSITGKQAGTTSLIVTMGEASDQVTVYVEETSVLSSLWEGDTVTVVSAKKDLPLIVARYNMKNELEDVKMGYGSVSLSNCGGQVRVRAFLFSNLETLQTEEVLTLKE